VTVNSSAAFYETRWRLVLMALGVYEATYLAGAFSQSNVWNGLGVVVLFSALVVIAPDGVFRPSRDLLRLAGWPLLTMGIATVINPANSSVYALIKFSSFYALFVVLGTALPYAVSASKQFNLFRALVIFPILVSLVWGRKIEAAEDLRTAGVFTNANNLALIALLIPWLAPERASRFMHLSFHGATILVIVLSSTLGALMAYVAAIVLDRFGRRSLTTLIVVLVVAIGGVAFFSDDIVALLDHVKATQKLVVQYHVLRDNFSSLSDGTVDFGLLKSDYGDSALSGIWRLTHWLYILHLIGEGTLVQFVFGHGVGSSSSLLPTLPHNDYLRVLFEDGALGLLAWLSFLIAVLRRVATRHRYLVLAFLVYSFTENNIDNFLFMALFAALVAPSSVNQSEPVTGVSTAVYEGTAG